MSERRFALVDFTHMDRVGVLRLYEASYLGVWRSFVAYSNADDTCEPEVISAHTLQCGSAIPRAAHLIREPFGRVGV